MIDPKTVRAINAAYAGLSLTETRETDLPIELDQLRSAIEQVAMPPTFHAEPADFRVALLKLAGAKP